MKLSDIVVKEAAPDAVPPGGTVELKDLVKNFPNTYKKAVVTLAKSGRLTYGGEPVFDKGGEYGPALDQAIASADELLEDEHTTTDLNIEMDGSVADIDDGGTFTADYPLGENQETFVGYSVSDNLLIIGYDVWLDEEIFNQDWDKEFERAFGMDFDHDDPDHAKIFDHAWKEFKTNSFMGAAVSVNARGSASLEQVAVGGFHKGVLPQLMRQKVISFS